MPAVAPPFTSLILQAEGARSRVCLAILCAGVYLTGLGATHFWDDDETYFAEVAREMHQSGDWIVPRFNRELFSHKPPVMFWLMAGAFRLWGVNEFAARLPAAVFGLATVLLVARLGARLFSGRAGFWSGIILATSLNFVVIARAAACDAELVFFCTLAVFLYVRACQPRDRLPAAEWQDPTLRDWCGIYAAMGLAVLTKGPIGLLLPGCVLGLFRLSSPRRAAGNTAAMPRSELGSGWWDAVGNWLGQFTPARIGREVWRMSPFVGLGCVLLVSGPWFAAVGWQTDGEFLRGFFGTHHFHRFTAGMDNHALPAWFYLAAICVGFFPWILLARPVIVDLWQQYRAAGHLFPAERLLICWIVVWVGFFSLATTKFPHYVVPAYPALAILTGAFVARWEANPDLIGRGALSLMWGTLLLIGAGLLVVPPFVARHLQLDLAWLWLPAIPVLAGGAVALWLSQHRDTAGALRAWTISTALFLVALFAWTAAEVDRGQSNVLLARAMREADPTGTSSCASWHFFRPGLIYYSGEYAGAHRVERLDTVDQVLDWWSEQRGPSFVVARSDDLARHQHRLPADLREVARVPWFMKAGFELVLLQRPQQTGSSDRSTQVGQGLPVAPRR